MTNMNFRRTLVGAAVAVALGLAGDPAVAAPYKGSFDPYDFAGDYVINVDPACLTQGNGWFANAGICTASLTSAFAVITSTPPETYAGTVTFAPPAISSSSELFGLYVYGGKIDSFDTDLIPYVSGIPDPATAYGGPLDFWIQFVSGEMCEGPCGELGKGVYLFESSEPDPDSPTSSAEYLGPAEAVPEPGTLGLILGALGGGWLARRRRKDKAPPD